MKIPFNEPYCCGLETTYIKQAFANQQLSGDGHYTARASLMLKEIFQAKHALLTHSCTAALEMAAILLDISPGDEIIMPSFTFVSTANAFVMRGGTPVFVDIDPLTQNIDVEKIEESITNRTKAIVVVHYAGISTDMDRLLAIAKEYNIPVIEDAAQAIYATYKNRPLGSFGDLATVSFHETKNISCGEGGCLLINNDRFISRAEIVREKGTNRSLFYRGEVDKYTWVDVGSSYLPGEITAAFLCAQLEYGEVITKARLVRWHEYEAGLQQLTVDFNIKLMTVPSFASHNGHMYYLLCPNQHVRQELIGHMKKASIGCVFHYVPLHSSPAGRKFGKAIGSMENTDRAASCLLRLPMSPNLNVKPVLEAFAGFFADS